MELVTGRAGSPHITAQQDRQLHQGIFGAEAYILNTGNKLEPEVQSSNKIHIKDGALMFQGALFSVKVGTYDEVTINNGNQGMRRKDLIVARYHYDVSQNIESAEWVVIQGSPAANNPAVPTGVDGDIQDGDETVDCPVFVITLDGINVTGIDTLPEVAKTPEDIRNDIYIDLDADIETVATSYGMTVLHKKVGSLHTIRIAGDLAGTLTTHTFSIPEGCRPTQAVYEMTRIGNIWCEVRILSSGEVRLTADSTVNGGGYINKWITYA